MQTTPASVKQRARVLRRRRARLGRATVISADAEVTPAMPGGCERRRPRDLALGARPEQAPRTRRGDDRSESGASVDLFAGAGAREGLSAQAGTCPVAAIRFADARPSLGGRGRRRVERA